MPKVCIDPAFKDFFTSKSPQTLEAGYMDFITLQVHMHDIFIVCFLTYFCYFQSLIDTKRNIANIQKYSSNSPRYSKFSITPRFRQKYEAWLSVVAKNAELNLELSS